MIKDKKKTPLKCILDKGETPSIPKNKGPRK